MTNNVLKTLDETAFTSKPSEKIIKFGDTSKIEVNLEIQINKLMKDLFNLGVPLIVEFESENVKVVARVLPENYTGES